VSELSSWALRVQICILAGVSPDESKTRQGSGLYREHALDAKFLRRDAVWRANSGDHREVRQFAISLDESHGQAYAH
jgi:hypothetical protein